MDISPWTRRLARTSFLSTTLAAMCCAQNAPYLYTPSHSLSSISEDPTYNGGTNLGSMLVPANIFGANDFDDPDGLTTYGVAIVGADTSNGSWQYAVNTYSGPWIPFGSVSEKHALLLDFTGFGYGAGPGIRFVPNPDFNGTADAQFRIWDESDGRPTSGASPSYGDASNNVPAPVGILTRQAIPVGGWGGGSTAYSQLMGTFSISIQPVNDAPRLDISGNPHFASVAYGAVNDPGTRIDAMLATGAGGNPISDPDAGALTGIAVIGADTTYGTWEYTINGPANWTAMPAVAPTAALLLNVSAGPYTVSTDVRVRFIPSSPSFVGTISNALTFRAWDQGDWVSAGSYPVNPTALIGDPYYYSVNVETASITVTGASTLTPVTFTEPPVSDGGRTVYGAICPGTPEGLDSLLAAFASPDPLTERAFSWDGVTQDFVELPAHPIGGVHPETGFFIATRATLPVDFAGSISTMPYSLTLRPGWNLLGVPPLDDPGAGTVDQSHPWDDFALYDETMTQVTDPVVFTNVLGTPGSAISTARPYYWDGAAYTQVMTLETGKAYWFKNNASTIYTLQRTNSTPTPIGRIVVAHAAAAVGVRGTITDRGAPPALPTSDKAGAKASGGCGAGSAIGMIALGLAAALRGLGLRRR